MKTEHWSTFYAIDLIDSHPSIELTEDWKNTRWLTKLPKFKRANLSRLNEMHLAFATSFPKDEFDVLSLRKAFENTDQAIAHNGLSYRLAGMLTSVHVQVGTAVSKLYCKRNAILQSLEIIARQQHDLSLPLKGRYERDMDGLPLRMIIQDGRRILYSIAPNGLDEGGAEFTKGVTQLNYDFVIHLPK
jgi:hypothetical protein